MNMATVLIGKPAPAFAAESTFGRISLEQCRGRGVVLYFYPKDNTPGCTAETEGLPAGGRAGNVTGATWGLDSGALTSGAESGSSKYSSVGCNAATCGVCD